MAIQKDIQISFYVDLDGTNTSVSLDLERDPYYVAQLANFDLVNDPARSRASKPTAASGTASGAPSFTASVSGSVVTLTFGGPGTAGRYQVTLSLFY